MRNRLWELIKEKELAENRRLTYATIAAEAGVTERLVWRWVKKSVTRYDSETIKAFCDYFNCTPGDLIVYEPVQAEPS